MDTIVGKQYCVYLIGQTERPNALAFLVELENTYYSPDNYELNDSFHVYCTMYNRAMFFIAELDNPKPAAGEIEILAKKHNLTLINGKPFDGHEEFPAQCRPDACFTLETVNYSKF